MQLLTELASGIGLVIISLCDGFSDNICTGFSSISARATLGEAANLLEVSSSKLAKKAPKDYREAAAREAASVTFRLIAFTFIFKIICHHTAMKFLVS